VPWQLLAPLIDSRVKITRHPIAWAE